MNNHIQYQKTLREPISFVGIGLHSGERAKITLKPSTDSSGIYFLRRDVEPGTGLIVDGGKNPNIIGEQR